MAEPRLHRAVPFQKPTPGLYATKDAKNAVQRAGRRNWQTGVRQPYHTGDGSTSADYDFHAPQTFRTLRDAQAAIESQEEEMPRSAVQDLPFHDRRGL